MRRAALLLALLWATVLVPALPAVAEPVGLSLENQRDEFRLRLDWSKAPRYRVERDGRELVVRFAEPLGTLDLSAVQASGQSWLASVESGYDSLLLRAAQDFDFTVTSEGMSVVIAVRRGGASAKGDDSPTEAGDADADRVRERQRLRADILKARSLFESGSFAGARAILQKLIDEHPELREAHLALAEIETRSGHWRTANSLYSRVLSEVDDPAAARAKSELLHQQGQVVENRATYVYNRGADHQFQNVTRGRMFVGRRTDVEAEYEVRKVHAPVFTTPTGTSRNFAGQRDRVELRGRHELMTGIELGARLFTDRRTAGVGASATTDMFDGTVTGSATYHEPFWGTLSGLVEGGAVDRLGLKHHRVLSRSWTFDGAIGVNGYSIGGEDHGARTVSGSLAVRYLPPINDGFMSIGYILDTEQPWSVREKVSSAAILYKPVDMARRELHAVEIVHGRDILDYLSFEGSLSYGYDRYGGRGPGGSLSLIWRPVTPIELGGQATYVSTSATRGGTDSAVTTGALFGRLHF